MKKKNRAVMMIIIKIIKLIKQKYNLHNKYINYFSINQKQILQYNNADYMIMNKYSIKKMKKMNYLKEYNRILIYI